MNDFETELKNLLNAHCKENESDTPDFLLAKYLMVCLINFNEATLARDRWYGRDSMTRKNTPHEDTNFPSPVVGPERPGV